MSLGIQFVLAKQYSDNLSSVSSRGNINIAKEGKMSSKNKYGYRVNESRFPVPDGDNFEIIKEAFKMALNNRPLKEISYWINKQNFSHISGVKSKKEKRNNVDMTPQTLSRIFSDPFYVGLHIHGIHKIWIKDKYFDFQPMISINDFFLLRHKMNKTKAFQKKRTQTLLFQKMVTCGHCGNGMTPYVSYDKGGKQTRFLYLKCGNISCETRLEKGKRGVASNSQIRGKILFDFIYKFLENGIEVNERLFEDYKAEGQGVLMEDKKKIVYEINAEKKNLKKLEENLSDFSKSLGKADSNNEKILNIKIKECDEKIKEKDLLINDLKKKITKIDDLLQSQTGGFENFSNFFKNLLPIVKNSDDRALIDKIIKMIFSNFIIKDKKVSSFTLNPEFEKEFKIPFVKDCRGYKIRTCSLTDPIRAR